MVSFFEVVLVLNVLWFGAAFQLFSFDPQRVSAILGLKGNKHAPLYRTVIASVRFLGGMNLAMAVLAALVLGSYWLESLEGLFDHPHERAILAHVFAVAHATQWYFNVPVALNRGKVGGACWNVFKGPMLFIFFVDGFLALVNTVCGTQFLLL